jgi:cytoskeletal protein CcmA (bactofilin family)
MIISEQVDIKGDIEFETYLAIHGSFEGSITTNLVPSSKHISLPLNYNLNICINMINEG